MADKSVPLSIVIHAVDKATAVIRAVNAKVARATAPVRALGAKLQGLAEAAHLGKLVEGFQGVGAAVKDLLGKMALIGATATAAVFGLTSIVDEFDQLGDTAERIGVSVDFLAQMRFAAARSGASLEQLDSGLQAFSTSLGQARAGTGRMTAFLKQVSPALLTQLQAAQSNERAFLLLADAMAKIEDPAKRAALAQKTVGDAALAPLLARGSQGVNELRAAYLQLAGSQAEAAQGAGQVDDSINDLKAATEGTKAALIAGLAPALKQIVDLLSTWLVDHREDIKKWAKAIGDAIQQWVGDHRDDIDRWSKQLREVWGALGGIKGAAVALSVILLGPLLSSILTLSAALISTPVGWILLAITAIILVGYQLIKHWDAVGAWFRAFWDRFGGIITAAFPFIVLPIRGIIALVKTIIAHWDPIKAFFVELWDAITAAFSKAWDDISAIVDKVKGAVDWVGDHVGKLGNFLADPFGGDDAPALDLGTLTASLAAGSYSSQTRVKVDFENAPRGTRVTTDPTSTGDIDLSVGFQLLGLVP